MSVDLELARREAMWAELIARGGPAGVVPQLVKELRIHKGQQGIFRDQGRTGSLTPTGSGVAVGVLHRGTAYVDDLHDDGVIYHSPKTDRGARDGNEIAALVACRDLQLPLFVVVTPEPGARVRVVHRGWVGGCGRAPPRRGDSRGARMAPRLPPLARWAARRGRGRRRRWPAPDPVR